MGVLKPFSDIGAFSYVNVIKHADEEDFASSFSLKLQCEARRFLHARHLPHGTLTIKFWLLWSFDLFLTLKGVKHCIMVDLSCRGN